MATVSDVFAVISPQDAWAAIQAGALPVDVRADIADKARGRREYDEAHVPGAVYADMESDLVAGIGGNVFQGGFDALKRHFSG